MSHAGKASRPAKTALALTVYPFYRFAMSLFIATPRLTLREFEIPDLKRIWDISARPGFIWWNLDGTETRAESFIHNAVALAGETPRTCFKLAVCHGRDLIGYATIDGAARAGEGEPDVGYFIDPLFQNNGFATEAMQGLMGVCAARFARGTILHATTHPDNTPSQRVLEKLDFTRTGKTKTIETAKGVEPRFCYERVL